MIALKVTDEGMIVDCAIAEEQSVEEVEVPVSWLLFSYPVTDYVM